MSRRSSLRIVGAAAPSSVELCARAGIGGAAKAATPPAMSARRDSMGSPFELKLAPGGAPRVRLASPYPEWNLSRRLPLNDEEARRSELRIGLLRPAICASLPHGRRGANERDPKARGDSGVRRRRL